MPELTRIRADSDTQSTAFEQSGAIWITPNQRKEVPTYQAFLDRTYTLCRLRQTADAVYLVQDAIEDMLVSGRTAVVDEVLMQVDLNSIDTSTMISFLVATRAWKNDLRNRAPFAQAVETRVAAVKGSSRAEAMVRGLK